MFREQDTEARLPAILEGRVLESRIEPGDSRSRDAAPGGTKSTARRIGLGFNKRTLIATAAAIAIVAGGAFGTEWWVNGRYVISTDDAYVHAHNTTLASKISGYVASIPVEDNATIHAGDVIATIDDGDYKLAADAAREKVATQQATVDRIGRQVIAQNANVDQAKAQLVSALAAAKRTQLEFDRQQTLAAQKYASQQALEQATANRDQAAAAVDNAQAGIDAAAANLDVLKAQQQEAARTLDELKTAPQLARLQPGQPVSISVDALPGHDIAGRVASLSPASGAVFSLLPPDNATGNFTKIVQRLPVRIEVPADVAAKQVLRPGMSVVVSVNTKAAKVAGDGATKTALAGEGAATLR